MNAAVVLLMSLLPPAVSTGSGAAPRLGTPMAPVNVRLDITAPDQLKGLIHEHTAAALRSLGCVQLVEQGAEWRIQVITTTLEDAEGQTLALGLSFVVEQRGIHMKMLLALAQACRYFIATGLLRDAPLERDMRLLLRGVEVLPKPESLAVVSQHKMCVIAPDRVPQACREIVAAFEEARLRTQAKADTRAVAEASGPAAPASRPN